MNKNWKELNILFCIQLSQNITYKKRHHFTSFIQICGGSNVPCSNGGIRIPPCNCDCPVEWDGELCEIRMEYSKMTFWWFFLQPFVILIVFTAIAVFHIFVFAKWGGMEQLVINVSRMKKRTILPFVWLKSFRSDLLLRMQQRRIL